MAEITKNFTPKDTAQWKIIVGTESEIDRLARTNYKLDFKEGETVLDNPYLILYKII